VVSPAALTRGPQDLVWSKLAMGLRIRKQSDAYMKKVLLRMLSVSSLVLLLAPQATRAQGVLYLSNLGETAIGEGAIGSNACVAQMFVTGTNAGGYLVNSVQLLMNAPSGSPAGFEVSIFSKNGNPHSFHFPGDVPTNSLGTLAGPNPAIGGTLTYVSADGIYLSPSTVYFLVLRAATPTNQGAYSWSASSASTPVLTNSFRIENSYFASADNVNWTWVARQKMFQFGLYASAAPPPKLTIGGSGPGSLKVSWPNVGTYTLQQTASLDAPNWVTSPLVVSNSAGSNFSTFPGTNGTLFFRLKQ